jgi:hypothetical protein
MKRFTLIFLSLVTTAAVLLSQAPAKFSYQAVLRDASGEVLINHNANLRLSILQGSESGTAVYTETHGVLTNSQGLFHVEIGSGITTDDLSTINWSAGPYFIRTEVDETGGTNYLLSGAAELLSVPLCTFCSEWSAGPGRTTGIGRAAGS